MNERTQAPDRTGVMTVAKRLHTVPACLNTKQLTLERNASVVGNVERRLAGRVPCLHMNERTRVTSRTSVITVAKRLACEFT